MTVHFTNEGGLEAMVFSFGYQVNKFWWVVFYVPHTLLGTGDRSTVNLNPWVYILEEGHRVIKEQRVGTCACVCACVCMCMCVCATCYQVENNGERWGKSQGQVAGWWREPGPEGEVGWGKKKKRKLLRKENPHPCGPLPSSRETSLEGALLTSSFPYVSVTFLVQTILSFQTHLHSEVTRTYKGAQVLIWATKSLGQEVRGSGHCPPVWLEALLTPLPSLPSWEKEGQTADLWSLPGSQIWKFMTSFFWSRIGLA
jgi:hypothetical protein